MSRLDSIHYQVKNALVKDGWTITDDPYMIKYQDTKIFADLGAEKLMLAEKLEQKIVIETKSFTGVSKLQNFKEALGQYDIYLYLLEETAPERKLFIALDHKKFYEVRHQGLINLIVKRHPLPLILIDLELEEIVEWIN